MLISPTSVAAVSCHALSPGLSQLGYGFTSPPTGAVKEPSRGRRTARSRRTPDGRFAVLKQRSMSPMGGFRPYFQFVTCAVTNLAELHIHISSLFRDGHIP